MMKRSVHKVPKVSVIMPVYNGERFVEQALDSLLAQTFQDWELVIIDDGSTDRTPNILQKYSDERIKVIRQRNSGEAGARNTGLRHINGEYLAFLDADDLYLPNALEDLSSYLDHHPQHGAVFSDGYIFDYQGRELMHLTDVRPGIFTGNILDPLVLSPSVITFPVCTMTRISPIREHDLFFDEKDNLIGTDWDFWIRLAVSVEFGYLDKNTCKYRIHATNITRTTGSEKRRRDQVYRSMKILNSEWFGRLSLNTRQLFFRDLLSYALSGDTEGQLKVLRSEQFGILPASSRAELCRLVAIDVLTNNRNPDRARSLFMESLDLNPMDRKTRFLLGSLVFGRTIALTFVSLWRLILLLGEKFASTRNTRAEQLQKLLGVR